MDGHLFGTVGRKWLNALPLPEDERAILGRLMPELERVTKELAALDKTLAQQALADPRAMRLMTVPGISSIVAWTVLASIGDISRSPTPDKLSSYFGLTPKIRNPATDQPGTAEYQNRGMLLLGKCWSSRVVGESGSRTFARFLQARPSETRSPGRRCRDSAETGRRTFLPGPRSTPLRGRPSPQ